MSEEESLLKFPCQFAIKAMGKTSAELDIVVVEIVRRHIVDIKEGAITTRPSKDGNYTAVTILIEATSKQQLDAIYQDLSDHPEILMAL
ncbi:MAG: YbeD family protein [Methylobacter sp.]|jgi:putative lipoic acid-binding regulatory protein